MSESVPSFDRRTFLTAILNGAGIVALPGVVSCSVAEPGTPVPQTAETPDESTATSPDKAPAPHQGEFAAEPAWRQHFAEMTDGPIDTSVWRFDDNPEVPGYNNEAQGYSSDPAHVRIENGSLVLQAKKQPYAYPGGPTYEYTSGRIDTLESFSFTYGKIEATMQMPEGAGAWPAFWLLSANNPYTSAGQWETTGFYAKDGEVDIVEWYGHTPDMIEGTVHTYQTAKDEDNDGERDADAAHVRNEQQVGVPDASSAFHTYGAEITPDRITWTVDGKPYHTFEKLSDNTDEWPFTAENQLYVILNLAMGGSGGGPIDDSKAEAWKLLVKDVSYYPYLAAK